MCMSYIDAYEHIDRQGIEIVLSNTIYLLQ